VARATMRFETQAEHQAMRNALSTAQRGKQETVRAAEKTVDHGFRASGALLRGLSSLIEGVVSFLGGGAPKQTAQQQHQAAQARGNEEDLHAESYATHVQAAATEHDARAEAKNKAQQEGDLRLARTLGILATQESTLKRSEDERPRDRDRDYERER
jgi:hypothetical protein